jgi:tRNA threonylcarbamoyladenosine biosynthesis protein TsaE
MRPTLAYSTADAAETMALGPELAHRFGAGGIVYLAGDLGVGKTTLVRGLLRALGYDGRVKSPSYGLIESYSVGGLEVHHLDLYRLGHPEEIAYLGLEDLLEADSLMFIEWPERGEGWLPAADWTVRISHERDGRRTICLEPHGARA